MLACYLQVEVQGVLGQGAGGTVYRASWRGLPVALKTVVFEVLDRDQHGLAPGGDMRHEQAVHETAVATSLNHPNVVRAASHDHDHAI